MGASKEEIEKLANEVERLERMLQAADEEVRVAGNKAWPPPQDLQKVRGYVVDLSVITRAEVDDFLKPQGHYRALDPQRLFRATARVRRRAGWPVSDAKVRRYEARVRLGQVSTKLRKALKKTVDQVKSWRLTRRRKRAAEMRAARDGALEDSS